MDKEEEIQAFTEIYQSGFELDGLIQCLNFFVFEHFPGTEVTMKDITALHGLTAAFMALSKSHIKEITDFDQRLG
ncbi:hypothetical protein [Tetragenococcus muriaticus]|uniref:Uncharacterized protein n=2 Tax=Tetragenococcus muriaticus TaxID=64642 RepID=A0A091BWF9_9ENTE|nr:hypothetical protein [Tetragenococcus muriaticus]KFN89079.1 hypothetical protein TMU3MR103_2243 [Tetragenococcus muriaticus 3MR10-3]KFN89682.1 hypothetical protein TMUPMC115_2307 [Tetragenococcus muriaticus PMC-11-5]GMA46879.1 hypothetical protein GCM10025854_11290 [Tetragenococcus muriaticus]